MHADENVYQCRGLKSKFMNLRIVIDGTLVEKSELLLMQKIPKRPKSDRCFRIFIWSIRKCRFKITSNQNRSIIMVSCFSPNSIVCQIKKREKKLACQKLPTCLVHTIFIYVCVYVMVIRVKFTSCGLLNVSHNCCPGCAPCTIQSSVN